MVSLASGYDINAIIAVCVVKILVSESDINGMYKHKYTDVRLAAM